MPASTRQRSLPRRRICIATSDIVGPVRNGGIGTAYFSLARLLAGAGHHVTVLYGLGQFCESETIAHWVQWYRSRGIQFVPLPPADGPPVGVGPHVRASYDAYHWLKRRAFDVLHVAEWRGLGFFAATAKRQGLALRGTTICVGAHSPTLWHREGMNELATVNDLELDHLERGSVAAADVLWCPSRHMLAWLQKEQWTLPRRRVVRPYVVLDHRPAAGSARHHIDEFVFFGRLETRKGLDLFCDALDRLHRTGHMPRQVTFLGKHASVDGIPSDDYIAARARTAGWLVPTQVLTGCNRDEALDYLAGVGRLAVLPSRLDNLPYTVLECVNAGIPCVSTDVGGIPEIVAEGDKDRVLAPLTPIGLADRLTRALRDGWAPTRAATPATRTQAQWLRWHEERDRSASRPPTTATTPTVSVCMAHRNRPALLAQALRSIAHQDYPNVELVVVDDGSDDPAALRALARLEQRLARRGGRLLRTANRFPGAARNAAARAATGRYLLFMDDDNLAKRHAVSSLVRAIESSRAHIVTCFLDVFRGTTRPTRHAAVQRWLFLGGSLPLGLVRNVFGDTNCLVRRRDFLRLGGFSEDYGVGGEDWELLARAAARGWRVEVVPEALAWYRQNAQGVEASTSPQANQMRALRPYFDLVPGGARGLMHLAKRGAQTPNAGVRRDAVVPLDHVSSVVVFGAAHGGRLASELAARAGWRVAYVVDNNPALWGSRAHGVAVRQPDALRARDFDLVVVASVAGHDAIARQLQQLGLRPREDFISFLDPFRLGATSLQLLPW